MTIERAFESCGGQPELDLRVEHRRLTRAQFGNCLCGTPIAWHHSDDNRFLPCDHPDVIAARLHQVLSNSARSSRCAK